MTIDDLVKKIIQYDKVEVEGFYDDGSIGSVFASFCINDKQFYRCSLEINFENGSVYRNFGLMEDDESEAISLKLSTHKDENRIVKSKQFKKTGAGYQWHNFYLAIRDNEISFDITPKKVASSIKIIELMSKEDD